MDMKEENKNLIDELFTTIGQRVKDRKKSNRLSKYARIRHQNGRMLDVFLLYLSDNTASISFIDVETKVEVSTVDIREPDLRRLNLTYEEACEIYDEILKRSEVVKEKDEEELRCWICHRTEKQVIEEHGDCPSDHYGDIDYEDKKDSHWLGYVDTETPGYSKVLCGVCRGLIESMAREVAISEIGVENE